jgi:hypothetical protein
MVYATVMAIGTLIAGFFFGRAYEIRDRMKRERND